MTPILFNTDMVRAILAGRKTMTRRVSKAGISAQPPYWPGDILYVRETWRVQSARRFDADVRIEYKAGGEMVRIQFPGGGDQYHNRSEYDSFVRKWADDRWHPSIHMPRAAARIFLRVTEVRAERLQEIDDDGVVAEGLEIGAPFEELWDKTIKLSDRTNYGWNANPWVWVVSFEQIKKPGNEELL